MHRALALSLLLALPLAATAVAPLEPIQVMPALPTIPGLSADYLDGRDSADFANAAHDHDERYFTEAEADGRFLPLAGKAADSDLLDGLDSAAFAPAGHDHDDRYLTEAESDARYLGRTVVTGALSTGYVAAAGGSAAWADIPGLTVSLDLPATASVQLNAQGTQRHLSGRCHPAYRFVLDGAPQGDATWGQLIVTSTSANVHEDWSLARTVSLPAGPHVLKVQAKAFGDSGGVGCHVCAEIDGSLREYERCALNIVAAM